MRKINGQDMKRHNVHLVIDTIMRFGPISRTALRDKVGLTAASVINITNALLEQNIIVQEGHDIGAAKGRKALMLNINPAAFYTLGASLSTSCIGIGLADSRGHIIVRRNVPITNAITPEEAVDIIAKEALAFLETHQVDRSRLVGMGVAAPGPLDAQTDLITVPPDLPNWRNVPLQQMLQDRLQMPVCVAKETNAAALAEYSTGSEEESVFFLSLFRLGVGGGFVIKGNSLLGFHGSAGEVGHIIVDYNGRKCNCGSYGCLEAMISEEALLDEARKAYKLNQELLNPQDDIDTLTLEELFSRSASGDPICAPVVKRAANYLTMAICDVVHMVSPSRIVLGGPLTEMSPQLAQLAFQQVHSRSYPHDYCNIRLDITSFGEQVFLQGAISVAMAQLMPDMLENIPT